LQKSANYGSRGSALDPRVSESQLFYSGEIWTMEKQLYATLLHLSRGTAFTEKYCKISTCDELEIAGAAAAQA
jgi:hypothetical protein